MENHGLSMQRFKCMLYIKHLGWFSEGKGFFLTNKIKKRLKLLQSHAYVSKSMHQFIKEVYTQYLNLKLF